MTVYIERSPNSCLRLKGFMCCLLFVLLLFTNLCACLLTESGYKNRGKTEKNILILLTKSSFKNRGKQKKNILIIGKARLLTKSGFKNRGKQKKIFYQVAYFFA